MPTARRRFAPGKNIAMKVPPDAFAATVAFYEKTLGWKRLRPSTDAGSVVFDFGGKRLWIDRVSTLSQAEIWLEIISSDTRRAARHLRRAGAVRCDAIEPLPPGMAAFWIKNPAGIVHLVSER